MEKRAGTLQVLGRAGRSASPLLTCCTNLPSPAPDIDRYFTGHRHACLCNALVVGLGLVRVPLAQDRDRQPWPGTIYLRAMKSSGAFTV